MRGFGDRFIALVLALGLLAALTTGVRAGPYEDALARFTADSFDDTIEGINGVAASGNALAATVVAALQEGRLFFSAASRRVFFKDKSDRLIDAATGQPVAGAAPADLAPVRLNNRLRRIVEAALGGLTVMHPDPGKRLEAAQAVLRSKDANALPALEQAIAKETDARVKQALIEARAAVGLAITFGVMGVINMAHGEMVMLGAYTTFVVQEVIRARNPALFGYSLAIAIPLAFVVAGLIGILIERGIIRFLYGRPLETLLATWGLSLILQQAVRTGFGPTNKDVGTPSWMSGSFDLGQITITYNRLWIIVFTLLIFACLLGLLRFTRLGLEIRAVTQNRAMAASMGIRTSRIDALTFGLGSGIAGLAGVALSQIDNVSPNLGQGYIIDSFMVVVFGGVGNLWGTLVGAFTLGIANKFLEPYAGAVLGKIAILVLIILFIQKRPRGLFALKGRAVEA